MRISWLIILCASAGCTFESPGSEGEVEPDPDMDVDPGQDPAPEGRVVCDRSDPSLRLCVDFDGQIADRSVNSAVIAASQVSSMDRDGQPAAALAATSTMHIREDVDLDVLGGVSLDMWIRPMGTPTSDGFWILDNNQQYAASYTSAGTIRCVLSSASLDSAALPNDGRFHHVACTYDGAKLKVFLDGELSRCRDLTVAIPTTGDDGLAIGANLSGTDLAPQFEGNFVGGLDDVRVWARGDLDVCAAAGRTGCRTSCDGL
jgi:hypothetical protein